MSTQETARTSPGRPRTAAPTAERRLGLHWFLPDGGYRFRALDAAPLLLGREATADVHLPFSDVSRRHAEIRRDGPLTFARDLGSRNGTFLNGAPITEGPLSAGDLLRVGECLGVLGAAVPATTPAEGLPAELLLGPALAQVLAPVGAVARSDLPIVVEGETGTGKEVVARWVHARSERTGLFLGLNCASLPESLAEAELFGFQRGAFTGADRSRPGHFRQADGGTLLLDEITDLPLPLQAKLLRVLEQREVLSLGDSVPVPVNVRIVAATQEPLEQAVARQRFRPDLLARLRGVTVTLPPLRARREEIPLLFRWLLRRSTPHQPPPLASARLLEQLCRHHWPFNVRELAVLAKRMVALHGTEPFLTTAHLPPELQAAEAGPREGESSAEGPRRSRRDERQALIEALRGCEGNLTKAAERLGISRGKAYRLVETMNLDLGALRAPP